MSVLYQILPINMHRITARMVRGLLRMRPSRMRLNTGDMKAMTTRSPMGIRGTAMIQAKLMLEDNSPLSTARLHPMITDLLPSSFGFHLVEENLFTITRL